MKKLSEKMKHMINDIIILRHELHKIPELALHEEKTITLLMKYMQDHSELQIVDRGKWFYAYYDAGKDRKTIAFRADFDAVAGKDGKAGHYCGHDGHAAILAGFGCYVSETKPEVNVLLIFQPAEETGEGAALCRDILEEKNVSEIYGFHNIPGFEKNSVLLLPHTFACASTGMEITITGTPSHAAYPDAGRNPAEMISRIILHLPEYQRIGKKGLLLTTVIGVEIGSDAYGVSASEGILRLTLRAEYEDEFQTLINRISEDVKKQAEEEMMTCSIRYIDTFPSTENHLKCVNKLDRIAENNGMNIIIPEEPFRWSEDFGAYLQKVTGAFFGIGDGEEWPQLHTENYEFPDEIMETVLNMYIGILEE